MNTGRPNCAQWAILASLWLCASGDVAYADVLAESRFDTCIEGWVATGDPTAWTPEYLPVGGNPGGGIQVTDANEGVGLWLHAPARFLGDKRSAFRHTLSFQLRVQGAPPDSPMNSDVRLMGECFAIVCGALVTPSPDWTTYTLQLDATQPEPTHWRRDGMSGQPATDAEILDVLTNLNMVQIRAGFEGNPDQSRLDNVVLEGDCQPLVGDLDGDGSVGLQDLTILLAAFGTMCP